jgi:hypothetical protein
LNPALVCTPLQISGGFKDMPPRNSAIDVIDEYPLRWPKDYPRTLIDNRKSNAAWKKPFPHYRSGVVEELARMGVASATISRNREIEERKDPGVAIWFSMKAAENFDWQVGLGIDSPVPTLEEIDRAYKALAMRHHPDRGGDVELFKKAGQYREEAKAYVLGSATLQQDNCLPFDQFREIKMNLAAALAALRHFRGLERLGMPSIVARVMSHAFKASLPEKGVQVGPSAA